MHHISNTKLSKIIPILENKLSSGGYILLYEHDCRNKYTKDLLDILHLLYDCVINNISYDNFKSEHYSNYKSYQQWKNLFTSREISYIHKRRLDKSYYSLMR